MKIKGAAFKAFEQTKPFPPFSVVRMIPNLATVMAMCMGLTAIRFAFLHKFDLAAGAILIAAVLDALDGRLARLLGASSEFGAELDSLSDFVSFGVAPSIVMYFFSLHYWQGIGWSVCLFFAVCTGLRLARFNISSRNPEKPSWSHKFFTGVPAPAGALIGLFPLILYHSLDSRWPAAPWLSAPFLIASGILMISVIPTFSFKTAHISPPFVLPLLVVMGLAISFLLSAPWETLTVMILIYLILIPVGFFFFNRRYKQPLRKGPNKALSLPQE